MAELIDKDLLIRTLRHIKSDVKVEIDTRISTCGVTIGLLKKQGLLKTDGTVSQKGNNFLNKNKLCLPFSAKFTTYGVSYQKDSKFLKKLRAILSSRPAPNYKIDHQPLVVDLTGMRAHYIASEENLFDKDIAMVGDYDSTGIGINLSAKVKNMTVFDIDDRLLEYFENVAKKHNFPVDCVKQDLFENTPRKYQKKFDVFVTDPPYAMGGMKKFIEFGINLLKDGGVGYIAVPYHDSISWTERMLFEVNKLIVSKGCVITDTFKNFHRYQTADGLRSSLVRIKKGSNQKKINLNKMYSYKEINVNIPIIGNNSI